MIPTYDASRVSWKGHKGITDVTDLIGAGLGRFPRELYLKNPHTGRSVYFSVDFEDPAAEDGWDGEMCKYVSANYSYSNWGKEQFDWTEPLRLTIVND